MAIVIIFRLYYSFHCLLFACLPFLLLINTSTFAAAPQNAAVLSDANACILSLAQANWTAAMPSWQQQVSRTLAGLVGIGWDDLLNKATAPVFVDTFQKCQVTPDGVYLVPDGITVLPVQRSHIDSMARLYMSFNEYESRVTKERSVDAEAHFGLLNSSISGSYSEQNEEVKRSMFELNTLMLHTTLVYHGYTLIADETSTLAPGFRGRIEEIAVAVGKNLTKKATLLAELLIRDFGTHVVHRAEVGALIEKEDFVSISAENRTKTTLDSFRASAAASFGSVFKASGYFGKNASTSEMREFTSELRDSRFRTIGGPSVHRLIDWNGTENNHLFMDDVVAFDVKGIGLASLVNPPNFHNISFRHLLAVRALVQNASNVYYEHNTVRGCTEPSAENFNFQANVDDGSCKEPENNYTLGGVFQMCTPISGPAAGARCDGISQANLYTGRMSCPSFETIKAIQIFSLVHHFPDRIVTTYWRRCRSFLFWEECDDGHFDTAYKDAVSIDFYECRGTNATGGAMFGGIYSTKTVNPFTQQDGCPDHYVPFRMGVDHFVCLSRDYELGQAASIPFARFFSCQTADGQNKTCPDGFSQHLAGIFENCEVYYCVRSGAFNHFQHRPIQRPPFTDQRYLLTDSAVSMIYGTFEQVQYLQIPLDDALNRVDRHIMPALLASNDIDTKIDAFFNHTQQEILQLANEKPQLWATVKQLIQNGTSQNEVVEYIQKNYNKEKNAGEGHWVVVFWWILAAMAPLVLLIICAVLGVKKFMSRSGGGNADGAYQQINGDNGAI